MGRIDDRSRCLSQSVVCKHRLTGESREVMGMLARPPQVFAVLIEEEVLLLRLRPTPSTADALNNNGLLRAVQWCSPRGMAIVKQERASDRATGESMQASGEIGYEDGWKMPRKTATGRGVHVNAMLPSGCRSVEPDQPHYCSLVGRQRVSVQLLQLRNGEGGCTSIHVRYKRWSKWGRHDRCHT